MHKWKVHSNLEGCQKEMAEAAATDKTVSINATFICNHGLGRTTGFDYSCNHRFDGKTATIAPLAPIYKSF